MMTNLALGESLKTGLAASNATGVTLLRLHLNHNAKHFAEGLGRMAFLQVLTVEDMWLGEFARWMPNMKNLTQLFYELGSPESAAAALRGLEVNPPINAKIFSFVRTWVGQEEGQRLPKILQKLVRAEDVALYGNNLHEAIGEELVEAAGEMKNLGNMDLKSNGISHRTKEKIEEVCRVGDYHVFLCQVDV